ncbi:hypothetical protein J2Z82_001136 [Virgibacillus litoralis]|uniref:Uncharacterized protein n=1 Tax=Virgibacillus litoralis TaxID=578221 RepID=A0ABS4HBB9_9BACI|nr:hypothetical protein [Virgibacillus litoralis]
MKRNLSVNGEMVIKGGEELKSKKMFLNILIE